MGIANSNYDAGTASYDHKPYLASSSGTALFRDGSISLAGSPQATGAVTANARTSVYYVDEIVVHTAAVWEPIFISYSLVVQSTESGSYSVPGADVDRLQREAIVRHWMSGPGDQLVLWTQTFWDSATGSLAGASLVNGMEGSIAGVWNVTQQITSEQWTDFTLHVADGGYVNPYANSSGSYGSEGATGAISFSTSVFWGGITSVTRLDGTALNYTLESKSGVDYSRSFVPSPVPESDTWLMLGLGLAVLALRQAKRAAV